MRKGYVNVKGQLEELNSKLETGTALRWKIEKYIYIIR